MSASGSIYADPKVKPALDQELYSLKGSDLLFFKTLTGIEDEDELKRHILSIQAKAYDIYGYPCIRSFSFLRSKISRLPAYPRVMDLVHKNNDSVLLDLGCCFGSDVRKAVADGWPVENVVASDLRRGFWDYGHELFRSTINTFPAAFVEGDAFDSGFIHPRDPFYVKPSTQRPTDLHSITTLTLLQGHISAIHTSSLFHLFNEDKQTELARRVATLLSPEPGSVIFGFHGGRTEKGLTELMQNRNRNMFCHSPESWRDLWEGQIFEKGTVRVEATLHRLQRPDLVARGEFFLLSWSVTRV